MSERYELPAELNIYSVMEVRDALLAWVSKPDVQEQEFVEVSAAQVGEVDGSGLQLLAALANMEKPWHLVAASDTFVEACRTLGFGRWLDAGHLDSAKAGA
jgi:ABC-type transporter Mla MlaB component